MNADPALKVLIFFTIACLVTIGGTSFFDFKKLPRIYLVAAFIFLVVAYVLVQAVRHQCSNETIFRWC